MIQINPNKMYYPSFLAFLQIKPTVCDVYVDMYLISII